MKKIFVFIALMSVFQFVSGQDISDMLNDSAIKKTEIVHATFKGTRLINFHTIETVGRRTLEFRVAHRFGDLSSGGYGFYGLDGPASLNLSFNYSFDGRFEVGISRTSTDKLYSGYLKFRLLRQTENNKMPISVTLFSEMNINGLKSANTVNPEYHYFDDRFSYVHQIMIARKFSEAFSFQVAPTLVHYNLMTNLTDQNDIFSVVGMGRMKISKRTALTAEYCYRLNKYVSNFSDYHNSVGVGMDLETGGHVFQFFFTNSFGINEAQAIPYTKGDVTKGNLKLGFNISRVFTL
ncbi:MAG: DUF5777 family beta-barrel protein [Bacteroidota bacterium]